MQTRRADFLHNIDWFTIILYALLVLCGWVTIYAASYNFDSVSIFDMDHSSGKQMLWIGLSLFLIFVIMSIDAKVYMTYAPMIYIGMMLLLLVTIFVAPDIKGSHSWLKFGSFSVQPAEFGKFCTALMLGWLFNTYNFKFTNPGNFIKTCLIVLLPVGLIIMQRETGSALVYFSLILLFYRQGMSGIVLVSGLSAILIFVLAVKYSVDPDTGEPSFWGQNLVLTIIALLISGMLFFYAKNRKAGMTTLGVAAAAFTIGALAIEYLPMPFELEYRWIGWAVCAFDIIYCVVLLMMYKAKEYLLIALFSLFFIGFLHSVDYAFNKVLEPHQRIRIEVLLGMKDDLKGAGYNVNQAKIAIGSGGFTGKGFLLGTQTKLKYVPEQETDFIFCTVGEEEGFLGACFVLTLYGMLVLRLLYLAERQRTIFAQVYGYCVASIFAFHVMINVGMVIGLCPVIGIPLPFFSYGGSGLWSFTILLFILLKLDSVRTESY